ncbi:hypothetical protein [Alkalihalobacterium alkalinitrilicum]|uniref:hypothetical protein n=1 Tax=Alkalihalobacterium alkalinitrilicum TaxID=427920 RepID=UPI0009951C3C|nr:hypothetical protein [Alkalihalobacterium alkalinitrilicum]
MKNTLIICNCNQSLPFIIKALDKKRDEVSVISGYQPYIVHPYDSLLRTIIMATHQHDTKEVIFISVKDNNLETNIPEWTGTNRTKQTIDLMNYTLNNQEADFGSWLGEQDVHEMLRKSIQYVKQHPLLPANVNVKGLIWEDENIIETAS